MNKIIALLVFLNSFCLFAQENTEYQKKIETYRHELNKQFGNKKYSPLPPEEVKMFRGLPFFPINENYKVQAKLNYTFNSPVIYIQSTGGQTSPYQEYAKASFTLNNKTVTLSIYQNLTLKNKRGYENYLFIPFNDLSNGKTTYSGGRYIDAQIPENGTGYLTIDFNKAYNPYCAYNKNYTCPIPPKGNNLAIEILAGVKY